MAKHSMLGAWQESREVVLAVGPSPTCTRHLAIAHGSAVETADLIALMIDAQIVPPELGARLRLHSERSLALLVGLMKQRRPRA